MLRGIIHSKKTKVYTGIAILISIILIVVAVSTPISKKGKAAAIAGEKGMAVADTLSSAIAHYGTRDLVELRSTTVPSQIYQGLSGLLYNTTQKVGTGRIYSIYKGVGGKYYYILDSNYNTSMPATSYAIPSQTVENNNLKSKSLLDKITTGKEKNGYSGAFTAEDGSLMVTAYSPVIDKNGEIAAIIAVECRLGDKSYGKLGFVDMNILLTLSVVVLLLCCILAWFIFRGNKKSHSVDKSTLFGESLIKDIEENNGDFLEESSTMQEQHKEDL